MSKLLGPLFEHSPLMLYPIVSLVIFMAVFALVATRAARKPRTEMDRLARSPLDDGAPADEESPK